MTSFSKLKQQQLGTPAETITKHRRISRDMNWPEKSLDTSKLFINTKKFVKIEKRPRQLKISYKLQICPNNSYKNINHLI